MGIDDKANQENSPETKKLLKKVALYPRVSTIEQIKTGQSFEAQESKFKNLCVSQGKEIVKIYKGEGDVKDDRSASIKDESIGIRIENHNLIVSFDLRKRPNFEQMLQDASKGLFDEIMFFKWDRFSRNVPFMYLTLIYFRRLGIELTPTDDTKDPLGIGMMSIINQTESEKTSARVSLTLASKFERGVFPSVRMPFGYRWNQDKKIAEVSQKEAQIVRCVFMDVADGVSYRDICQKYKLPIPNFYFMVRNRAYIGMIEYQGKEKRGIHEPLISEELFNRVQEKIKSR